MVHVSDTLAPPSTETTIAVVLGASEYPQKPDWSNPVLGASARAVRDYLRSPAGLAMSPRHILDLFDAAGGPAEQLFEMEAFLKTAGASARDLIVYYVGHGCFDHDDYCLGIRATQRGREFLSTIESKKLARVIREGFARRRVYVILDSCFAASAASDFQGNEIEHAVRKMSHPLPRHGTVFLAAASKFDVTRAPRDERHTVFTGAVLEALTTGIENAQPKISLYELYEEVRDRLARRVSDEEARPELHVPSQREGDVSRVELFPNPAYQHMLEAVRARSEAATRSEAETVTARARAAEAARVEADARPAPRVDSVPEPMATHHKESTAAPMATPPLAPPPSPMASVPPHALLVSSMPTTLGVISGQPSPDRPERSRIGRWIAALVITCAPGASLAIFGLFNGWFEPKPAAEVDLWPAASETEPAAKVPDSAPASSVGSSGSSSAVAPATTGSAAALPAPVGPAPGAPPARAFVAHEPEKKPSRPRDNPHEPLTAAPLRLSEPQTPLAPAGGGIGAESLGLVDVLKVVPRSDLPFLFQTSTLRGVVTSANDHRPISGVPVELFGVMPSDKKELGQIKAITDGNGAFVFTNVPVGGPYRVVAWLGIFKSIEEQGIYLIPNNPREVALATETSTLRGVVTSANDHRPISGAGIVLHNAFPSDFRERHATTDGEGAFVFTDVPVGGTYRVVAVLKGFDVAQEKSIYLTADKTHEVALVLYRGERSER